MTYQDVKEPLYCSQGGVPYNKAHLDARDAEIRRLLHVCKDKTELLRDAYAQNERMRAALAGYDELKHTAADPRFSSEAIGIRLRNMINNEQKASK